jgi:hypothetical protein
MQFINLKALVLVVFRPFTSNPRPVGVRLGQMNNRFGLGGFRLLLPARQ